MPTIATASMSPRLVAGDSACNKVTASHEPASNASNATTCTECHAGLKVLPNIEQAMLSSMIQDTNRNGTPSTGKIPATPVDDGRIRVDRGQQRRASGSGPRGRRTQRRGKRPGNRSGGAGTRKRRSRAVGG